MFQPTWLSVCHLNFALFTTRLTLFSAPAREIVRKVDSRRYDGEIFQTNKYRAAPGVYPESIDKAWTAIGGGVRVLRLDGEEVRKIGVTDDDPFRPFHIIPDEEGGYAGVLEVFHLLHCLVGNPSARAESS
jgi:hypothetical protein